MLLNSTFALSSIFIAGSRQVCHGEGVPVDGNQPKKAKTMGAQTFGAGLNLKMPKETYRNYPSYLQGPSVPNPALAES